MTGLIGIFAATVPSLWLDLFTTDPQAYEFGVQYLVIAAPFYGVFGLGQALYFASQGTGRMVLPVTATVLRFVTVAGLGGLAITFAWEITSLFAAVAIGLIMMDVGQALCLLGQGWHRPTGADFKPAAAPRSRH